MAKELTMKEIWDTLSKVDVSPYTETKMNLTYLSWARAWMLTVEKYADARYEFHDFDGIPYRKFPDGTGEVVTSVTIGNHTRSMPLPIMDNKNNAITNPNARQVNDNRMRCLVKNLAMGFGLGMSVFAQHDFLPTEEEEKPKPKPVNTDAEKEKKAKEFILNVVKTVEGFGEDVIKIDSILKAQKKVIDRLEVAYPELHKEFMDKIDSIKNKLTKEVKEDE